MSSIVDPVQAVRYVLSAGSSTQTFGAATSIAVVGANSMGIWGDLGAIWSVTNAGSIYGGSFGVALASAGSSVTNTGAIRGTGVGGIGVWLQNGGDVANNGGTIWGDTAAVLTYVSNSVVTNSGAINGGNVGVNVYGGGSVTNQSMGTIVGGMVAGVYMKGGDVDNFGQIKGGGPNVVLSDGTDHGTGLYMANGGVVTNEIGGTILGQTMGIFARTVAPTVDNYGTISGDTEGISIASGVSGAVTNFGAINATSTNGTGIQLGGGGSLTNQLGGSVSGTVNGLYVTGGSGAVTNSGVIAGGAGYSGYGVYLQGGGTISNLTTGAISAGGYGVLISAQPGTVTNSGQILGLSAAGGVGVKLMNVSGGAVNNQVGGTISGAGFGLFSTGATASVTNAGVLTGTQASAWGAYLQGGGTLINKSGGSISGGSYGVSSEATAALTNAGTIGGAVASVTFAGAGANSLTLQTGSRLNGVVQGSLASGATNALVLTGQGRATNDFVNFTTVNAKATGTWSLGGSMKVSAGVSVTTGTLVVNGTLNSAALKIAAGAKFYDAGDVSVSGAVTNAGNLTIDGTTMRVAEAGGSYIQLAGGTTTLLNGGTLDPPNVIVKGGAFGGSGPVVGNVRVMDGTLRAGGAAGGSLSIEGNFAQRGGKIVFNVSSDGHGGFLESHLLLDPTHTFAMSNTDIAIYFSSSDVAHEFVAGNHLSLDTFFAFSDGGQLSTGHDLANLFKSDHFTNNIAGLSITGFDGKTGALSVTGSSFT